MFHQLYKALAPRGWFDTFVKIILFTALICALNYLYSYIYFGAIELSHRYLVLNAVFVGAPFVILFYLMVARQFKLQVELAHRSRTDELTSLSNRRYFLNQTKAAMGRDPFGMLLLLDADRFKSINDTYGHPVGDLCLVAIADYLRSHVRADDVVGRLGGEEFGIYLSKVTIAQARKIGEALVRPISFSVAENIPHLAVTLSIGAVETDQSALIEEKLQAADQALYAAKSNGRARMEIFDPTEIKSGARAESGYITALSPQ